MSISQSNSDHDILIMRITGEYIDVQITMREVILSVTARTISGSLNQATSA
jgi:hypothetical protein